MKRSEISHKRGMFGQSINKKPANFAGFLGASCLVADKVFVLCALTTFLALLLLLAMCRFVGGRMLGRNRTRTLVRGRGRRRTRFMRLRHHANRLTLLGTRYILMPHGALGPIHRFTTQGLGWPRHLAIRRRRSFSFGISARGIDLAAFLRENRA